MGPVTVTGKSAFRASRVKRNGAIRMVRSNPASPVEVGSGGGVVTPNDEGSRAGREGPVTMPCVMGSSLAIVTTETAFASVAFWGLESRISNVSEGSKTMLPQIGMEKVPAGWKAGTVSVPVVVPKSAPPAAQQDR